MSLGPLSIKKKKRIRTGNPAEKGLSHDNEMERCIP